MKISGLIEKAIKYNTLSILIKVSSDADTALSG